MDALLPIIRRKRRPLLPVESLHDLPPEPAPVVAHDVKLVEVVAAKPTETVVTDEKAKLSDDEVS